MPPRLRVPPQDPNYELGISPEEAERLAAGDIALLDDPIFNGYKWSIWRHRLPEEIAREPEGGEWERVAIKIGPMDDEWAQASLGGGTFDFRGYFDSGDGSGKNMKRRQIITLAGPRKNFAAPAPAPPAVAAAAPSPNGSGLSRSERIILKMMRALDKRLERVELAPTPASPAVPAPTMKEMVETLMGLETLRSRTVPPPPQTDSEFLKMAMDTLRQGIEIGQTREPAPPGEGGTDWLEVAKMTVPVLERMIAHRQGRAQPRPRSRAEVIPELGDTPRTGPAPAEPREPSPKVSHRWVTAIESLARAVLEADDPIEWAYWLRGALEPSEFGLLRLGDIERVMGDVRAIAGEREELAIIHTDHARDFVAAVLEEIKHPSGDGDPETDPSAPLLP